MATTISRAATPGAATTAFGTKARGVIGRRRRRRARAAGTDTVDASTAAPAFGGATDDARAELRHDALAALLGIEAAARALAHRDLLTRAQSDELAEALVAEVHRLAALLRDEPTAAAEQADLREAVAPMVACARAVGLDVRLDLDAGIEVAGSAEHLGRAVLSLLDNARRHAPGSEVHVRAEVGPDEVELRVDDRGPGIPPELRTSVFGRGIRRGPGAGSGLGLHVARSLVAASGGSLHHEPRPGGGSSFVLRLRRAAPAGP